VQKHLPGLGLENQRKAYPEEAQNRELLELRQSIEAAWPGRHAFQYLGELGVVDSKTVQSQIRSCANKGFKELSQMFMLLSAERWTRTHSVV
jgi:hypothetical protein